MRPSRLLLLSLAVMATACDVDPSATPARHGLADGPGRKVLQRPGLMFPLLLQGLCEQVCARGGRGFRPSRAVLVTCVLLTAVCFSAIKVSDVAAEGWRWGLGFLQWPARGLWALLADTRVPPVTRVVHTVDATDLFTLPALLVSLAVGWRRLPSVPRAGEGGTQAAHRDPHLRLAAPGP